jgi:hypothetical protein
VEGRGGKCGSSVIQCRIKEGGGQDHHKVKHVPVIQTIWVALLSQSQQYTVHILRTCMVVQVSPRSLDADTRTPLPHAIAVGGCPFPGPEKEETGAALTQVPRARSLSSSLCSHASSNRTLASHQFLFLPSDPCFNPRIPPQINARFPGGGLPATRLSDESEVRHLSPVLRCL